MKVFFVVLAVLFVTLTINAHQAADAVYPTELTQNADDQVFKFTNKMGTVTFNHSAHQLRVDDCSKCHPPFEQKYDDNVLIKDNAHKTCIACHKEHAQNGHPAPVKCTECHQKAL